MQYIIIFTPKEIDVNSDEEEDEDDSYAEDKKIEYYTFN